MSLSKYKPIDESRSEAIINGKILTENLFLARQVEESDATCSSRVQQTVSCWVKSHRFYPPLLVGEGTFGLGERGLQSFLRDIPNLDEAIL